MIYSGFIAAKHRSSTLKLLVTGCCGIVSRAVARSIRLSEHYDEATLIGVDVCENWYGLHESDYNRIYRISDVNSTLNYQNQVQKIISSESIDLAIVVPEKEVLFWAQNNFEIPVTLPPPLFSKLAVNKRKLYECLANTGLVPAFKVCSRDDLLTSDSDLSTRFDFPCWIRDYATGSDSGKGALMVNKPDEIRAWVTLNPNIDAFMVSAFLPGRNFAQCLLYDRGRLLKHCSYERLEYLMKDVAPSGVTGNISRGRLVNERQVLKNAMAAVEEVSRHCGEKANGLLTVDLREDQLGNPLVTEINIRHTAATSAYAAGGCNMVEAQIHHTLVRNDLIDDFNTDFAVDSYILRDIDGKPLLVDKVDLPEPGKEFYPADITPA
jgi:carbamoyl-phosphate synthase large subunit